MLKPWHLIPTKWGHSLSPHFLSLYGKFNPYQTLTWKPFQWRGLEFSNPLGTAGGFDKNAKLIKSLWTLGPGFLEVGTITPYAQKPNTGKIIARDLKSQALWNKMGFPNDGADTIKKRMLHLKRPHFTPLFINIGKNRTTPLERSSEDYISLIQSFSEIADAFVINISSPNTQDLRSIFEPKKLKEFLTLLVEENKDRSIGSITPLLLKISPDMEEEDLKKTLDISLESGIDGWILTNTTLDRPPHSSFSKLGGLSGKPLAEKSKAFLKLSLDHLGSSRKDKLIVSVGGILSSQDVFERLQMGADLVQVYSALVFDGPFFFRKVFMDSSKFYSVY